MEWIQKLRADQIFLFIPIAAILTWGAVTITKLWIRHRERLAMIQRGMNPDLLPHDEESENAGKGRGAPQ